MKPMPHHSAVRIAGGPSGPALAMADGVPVGEARIIAGSNHPLASRGLAPRRGLFRPGAGTPHRWDAPPHWGGRGTRLHGFWVIGLSIGRRMGERSEADDARHLDETLEHTILPLHAHRPASWAEVMRLTIALDASFFNTHRMLQEYVIHAYQDQKHAGPAP
jgi:hypothetical protein